MSNLVADPGAPAKEPVKLVYNRSTANRFYILRNKRKLLPGQSAEVGLDEYKFLTGYKDIVDADKMIPKAAERTVALTNENARLKSQLAGLEQDPVIAQRLKEISEAAQKQEAEAPKPKPQPKKEATKKVRAK